MPSINRSVGGFKFPITVDDLTNGVWPDLARDKMLALFEAAINAEFTDAWSTAVAGTPLAGSTPVKSTLPLAPRKQILEVWKPGFPLLALHRSGEGQSDEFTLQNDKSTQRWELHYILTPLAPDDEFKLDAVPRQVVALIKAVISMQGHPAYESGVVQFRADKGGLNTVRMVTHQVGQAAFAEESDGQMFLAATMVLETTEIERQTEGTDFPLEGMGLTLGVGSPDGIVPELVKAQTETPLVYG